jgi:para-aminobenzoate synthetase component 1
MADPLKNWTIREPQFGIDPFSGIEQAEQRFRIPAIPELPPFQGGVAGMMAYEFGRCWERVPAARHQEFDIPAFTAGLYDWVIAWDHAQRRCWLVSHGLAETDSQKRSQHAKTRGQRVTACLENAQRRPPKARILSTPTSLQTTEVAPLWAAPGLPGLLSDFSREGYVQAVERVLDYIRAGDIFQANLSQRLLYPLHELNPVDLFDSLRSVNPAPFAGLLVGEDWAVISASPERFLRVAGDEVETRPIKGTRRRPHGPEADLFLQDELRTSEKDLAENVMIVDLLRNDLSRVCLPGTVRVPRLCAVESYRTVQHLVSEIRGRLRPERSAWDLFRATVPGGSISGAPKVRAMEIIAELEPTARGPYTGRLFYVGFDGSVDSNLLIRTFAWQRGWLQCGVGGGIVAQSDPLAEYEETLHKAAGMLQALK